MIIKERIIKGGLSVMLAASMIIGTLPYGSGEVLAAQSISAETGTTRESTKVSGTWGTCNWTIDNGTLTISGGEVNVGRKWQSYKSTITKVVITGKIVAKGKSLNRLFEQMRLLETIEGIEYLDTSNATDMSYMFYNCAALKSLDLSNFDTSNVISMEWMFSDCSALTALDLSGFDTSKVTDMDSMFYGCSKLQNIDVSGFDTSKVTNMMFMFDNCVALKSLDLSNFDTSKVTSMGSMFYGCSKLQNIDVSGFDTSKVTDMGYMFSGCSLLTALDVSGFDTSKLTYMTGMFSGCSALTALDVSGFDTSKVTSMYAVFSDCSALTALDLSNFDISNVKEMSNMFYRDSISLIKLPVKLGNNGETFSNELKNGMTAGGWIDETTGTKYANVASTELLEGHTYKLTPKGEESSIEEIIENNNLSYSVNKNSAGIQMLTGVGTACKADTLKAGFGKNVVLKSSEGIQLADDAIIGTGCVVELTHEGNVIDTVNVVVKGDTDGTGTIDVLDMEVIQKSILGIGDKLDGAYREAASLSGEDGITVLDMEAVQKDILGIEKIN